MLIMVLILMLIMVMMVMLLMVVVDGRGGGADGGDGVPGHLTAGKLRTGRRGDATVGITLPSLHLPLKLLPHLSTFPWVFTCY